MRPATPTQVHLPLAWRSLGALGRAAVHGGAYVALGDAALVVAAAALLEVGVGWDFVAIVALGLYAVYGFNHVVEAGPDARSNPERAAWVAARRTRQAVLAGVAVVALYALPVAVGRTASLGWVTVLLGLGLAYSVGGKALTRRVPAFKTAFVATMFAALVPFLAAHAGAGRPGAVALVAALYGGHVAVNTAFCDLKDLDSDRAAGLKTVPAVLGVRTTLVALHAVNVAWGALVAVGVAVRLLQPAALALLPLVAYRAAYLEAGRRDDPVRRRFLADVVADGESFLWPLLLAVGVAFVGVVAPDARASFPSPTVPALTGWRPDSRTPLIADESVGAAACAGMGFVLGGALRWLLAAAERPTSRPGAADAVFVVGALVVVALTGLNACFATVVLSLVLGAAVAGSLRTRAHRASAVLVAVPCVVFQAARFEWGPLAFLTGAAVADEAVARRLGASSSRGLAFLSSHRPLWKGALVVLSAVAGWPVRYVVAVVAFDAGYAIVGGVVRARAAEPVA